MALDVNAEIWAAQLEVVPKPDADNPDGAIGAFVCVMGMASHPREFRAKLHAYMEEQNCEIIDVSESMPLELWLEFSTLNELQEELAKYVKESGETFANVYNWYDEGDEE